MKREEKLSGFDQAVRLMKLVKNTICVNQGAFIQYEGLTASLHMDMKQYLHEHFKELLILIEAKATKQDFLSALTNISNESFKGLANRCRKLESFLNERFQESISENFTLLHKLLQLKDRNSEIPPRICLKSVEEINGQLNVIDLFRDSGSMHRKSSPLALNTGFLKVYETGQNFFENDIPSRVIDNEAPYFNTRITPKTVGSFDFSENLKFPDFNWISCWGKSVETEIENRSCYKSTIIIPVTLFNHNLDRSFVHACGFDGIDRAIFAFLCIDHTDVDYFDQNYDVDAGYTIADLMSLYFMTRYEHISLSNSYKSAKTAIKYHEALAELKRI